MIEKTNDKAYMNLRIDNSINEMEINLTERMKNSVFFLNEGFNKILN